MLTALLALAALVDAVAPDVPAAADAARDAELARKAALFIDLPADTQPRLLPDGHRFTFISTRDGLPQLYLADLAQPEAAPQRLTTTSERVGFARPLPDGRAILLLSDQGADENWRILRVDAEGGAPIDLTPGEQLWRSPPLVPEQAPRRMIYAARPHGDRGTRLIVQPVTAGGLSRVSYADPAPGDLADVSPDGTRALFVRILAKSNCQLLEVDLGKGTARTLYPPAGREVAIGDARYTRDGRVLVSSDEGGEQNTLIALEPAGARETARALLAPPTATVTQLLVARRGDRLAALLDAGNHDEVRLFDARTLKPAATVELPLGSGRLGDFSDDGKRLTLAWSTPNAPASPWLLDVKSGRMERLRTGAPLVPHELPAIESSIVEVLGEGGVKIPVNLYLPAGHGEKRLPVLVAVHGGPFNSAQIGWRPFYRFFLGQGYAIIEPNVRGSAGFGRAWEMADDGRKRLDALGDLEAVGRWAAAQPFADPRRLVLYGASYGGYSVLMGLCRQPTFWRAGVDLFGISDVRAFLARTSGWIRELFRREFGEPEKDGPFLDSISPLREVGRIRAPLFVYAGANDPRVPRPESDAIVRALRERKIPVEYMVAANEGHSMDRRENRVAFLSRVARFLERHVHP
jgi:dipeptidyl aminopeptidase/acylaminoacyl peptidase